MKAVAVSSASLEEGYRFVWKNSKDKHQRLMIICMHYLDSSQLSEIFCLTNSFVPIIFSLPQSRTMTTSKIQGYLNVHPPPCYQDFPFIY